MLSYQLYVLDMGCLADIIRSSILEKYISSYMKERSADGVIVLRAGEGWIVSGGFCYINYSLLDFSDFESCTFSLYLYFVAFASLAGILLK